jgi:integrase/recombinase XerD
MQTKLSIRFYLNLFKSRGKRHPLYLRITLHRKKAEIATNHFLEPKEWDEETQRCKKNSQINEDLNAVEGKVYEIVRRLEKENKSITAHSIKNYFLRKDKLDVCLIEYYDEFLNGLQRAGELTDITIDAYGCTKQHLKNFLLEKRDTQDIHIDNVDFRFLTDFDIYMLNQKVRGSERRMERNTITKHHSRLRTVLIRALKEGFINKNPYWDMKLKKTPSKRTFLTEDELQKLLQSNLGENESLQKVRDIFIFSVYTGLRFEDAQQLTLDKITKDKKDNYTLQIEQEKTSELLSIPILKPALVIIEKYRNSPERKIFNKALPKISNQKLNTYLKIVADLSGITKNLSHHVARHTCATTILLSNEVPIEVVSKWLGHTNIKTTQIYAKITNSYLQTIAKNIESKI